jgi:hypothetical protein
MYGEYKFVVLYVMQNTTLQYYFARNVRPNPMAATVCGRSLPGIPSSNPVGGMDVFCDYCLLSGTSLCDGLITRPE